MKKEKPKKIKDKDRAGARNLAKQFGAEASARNTAGGEEDKKKTRSKSK
jgi:hypothetical protein